MPEFRRKPVIVNAVQFDTRQKPWPDGILLLVEHWSNKEPESERPKRYSFVGGHGAIGIRPGDWIVTNQTGERYVVLHELFRDVFESTERKSNTEESNV